MTIFFNFSPTSNHLHPLQVENFDSNSRLVVDEDGNGKSRLERVNSDTNEKTLLLNIRCIPAEVDNTHAITLLVCVQT